MRYLLFALLFIGWLLLCSWLYCCHIKQSCCPPDKADMSLVDRNNPNEGKTFTAPNSRTNPSNKSNSSSKNITGPLLFNWSSEVVEVSESGISFIDSLTQTLKDKDQLEITGSYFRDETNESGYADLGLARAINFKNKLAFEMDTTRVIVKSNIAELQGDSRNSPFEALAFKRKIINDFVQEVNDKVLIYFPQNSSLRFENPQIETYLVDVVKRVKQSGEKVYLTGHTDVIGPAKSNEDLAYFRAGGIKDVLLKNGLSADKVLVDSKGEREPIATNKTDAGRKKNRRVELVIK